MSKRTSWSRIVLGFATALVVGAGLGSVVQTQVNLLALAGLGVDIGVGPWLMTTLEDLFKFGPVYLVMFGCSFLLSQMVAMVGTRFILTSWRVPVCAIAAAVGLWATFKLVDSLAPPPTLIAATRDIGGMLAMLATAAIAGWVFARMAGGRRSSRPGGTGVTAALILVLLTGFPQEQALAQADGDVQVETVVSGLEYPWSLAFLPDGGMLVTERPGRLRRVTPQGELDPEPIRGVPEVLTDGQAGLFEVSLAPDFADSGQLYLSYACGTVQANHTCLARARLEDNALHDLEEIFRVEPAKVGTAHYGGRIAWLPDGTLVLSLGDGFDYREEAQRLTSHIGTLVRLRPDGSVPPDNPFVDDPDALPEIYSYGHRNVQGLAYDSVSGQLIAHEHGPRGGDEVNIIEPGANYGWPVATHGLDYTWARVTPFTEYPGTEQPSLYWTPSIAPSGLVVYRGDAFSEWKGDLLVGALADHALYRVSLAGLTPEQTRLLGDRNDRVRDVRVGPDGLVYLLTDHESGQILRLRP